MKITVKINDSFKLSDKQREIINATESDLYNKIVVCTGRQVGKSTVSLLCMLNWCIKSNNVEKIGFYSPVAKQCRTQFDRLRKILLPLEREGHIIINKTQMLITFTYDDSFIKFISADSDTMRGESFTKIVVDEACFIKDGIWVSAIQPTISAAISNGNGKVLLLSTPKNKGWFYDEVMNKSNDVKSKVIRFTSLEGGILSKEVIEQSRRSMPESIFNNEYLGKFVEDGSDLFKYKECLFDSSTISIESVKERLKSNSNSSLIHYAGIDIGIKDDETVLTVMSYNKTTKCIKVEYQEGYRYIEDIEKLFKDEIIPVLKLFKYPFVNIEQNGIGIVPTQIFSKLYGSRRTKPFTTTQKTKHDSVVSLQYKLVQNKILIPDSEVLLDQLDNFKAIYGNTGKASYKASNGRHDDYVMSLLICLSLVELGIKGVRSKEYYDKIKKFNNRKIRSSSYVEL